MRHPMTTRWSRSILALALLVPTMASAAERPEGEPRARVDATYTKIKAIAAEAEDQDALVAGMTTELDKLIDYEGFSKKTLKGTWETLSDADKDRFMTRFKQLIIQTYAKRFKPKTEFSVSYRGETAWDDDKSEGKVKTTVKGKKIGADVDYFFHAVKDSEVIVWRAYDIEIDEVSMALNWRKQFNNIIKKNGFDSLIERIEKKVAKKDGD